VTEEGGTAGPSFGGIRDKGLSVIWRVKGKILDKGPSHLVIDVGGLGLLVRTPVSSVDRFGREGQEAEILTHFHVRDDSMDLYGFVDESQRRLFRMLLAVSGIGPRSALGILSGMSTEALQAAILSGDVATLTRIPGVGRKTAQRIVVELKGPLSEGPEIGFLSAAGGMDDRLGGAVEALVALGYRRSEAYRSAAGVIQSDGRATLEDVVKRVLAESMGKPRRTDVEESKAEVGK
jgi:Holliday junction DNA helicase RuvA